MKPPVDSGWHASVLHVSY